MPILDHFLHRDFTRISRSAFFEVLAGLCFAAKSMLQKNRFLRSAYIAANNISDEISEIPQNLWNFPEICYFCHTILKQCILRNSFKLCSVSATREVFGVESVVKHCNTLNELKRLLTSFVFSIR